MAKSQNFARHEVTDMTVSRARSPAIVALLWAPCTFACVTLLGWLFHNDALKHAGIRLFLPLGLIVPISVGWLSHAGHAAGPHSQELGVALMVTTIILTFGVAVWWNARARAKPKDIGQGGETKLAHAASYDRLTELPNRAIFMDRITARITAYKRRPNELFAIIYLDVDDFNQVNDRLGRAVGDDLLRQIANLLVRCVRGDDLVARMGGDEFAILLDRVTRQEGVDTVVRRILSEMRVLVNAAEQLIGIGLSMGVVTVSSRHLTADVILQDGESALYEAKQSGKGQAQHFDGARAALKV